MIVSKSEFLLAELVEDSAAVQQHASRALRWGLSAHSDQFGSETHRDQLLRDARKLKHAIEQLESHFAPTAGALVAPLDEAGAEHG